MTDSMYDYVLSMLDTSDETYTEIAEASGVPLSTVTRIARKYTTNPTYESIEKLYRYFRGAEQIAS